MEMQGSELHYIIENSFDRPVEYDFLLPEGWIVSAVIPRGRQEGFV